LCVSPPFQLERALLEKEHEKEELQQTIVALEADLKEKASADGQARPNIPQGSHT
jgi:type II secretory pathway component PulJ